MTEILLTTLGGSWQVVPELVGFTNPGVVDLYQYHSEIQRIQQQRAEYGITPVDELWVITTLGNLAGKAVSIVKRWCEDIYPVPRPVIRIWQVEKTDEMATEKQCRTMAEAIHRLVFTATKNSSEKSLLLSLTGGRKTMSADLQQAAESFGCQALLHIIDNSAMGKQLRSMTPEDFTRPLPASLKNVLTPLVVSGPYPRNPILDADTESSTGENEGFVLEMPRDMQPVTLRINDFQLIDSIRQKRRQAGFFYYNSAARILQKDPSSNFMALYSLAPEMIRKLRNTFIGVDRSRETEEIDMLRKFPKADLHCHLGGIADAPEMIEIAAANHKSMEKYRDLLGVHLTEWRNKMDDGSIGDCFGENLKKIRDAIPGVPAPVSSAAFIMMFQNYPEWLEHLIYGPYLDQRRFVGIGFEKYEQLGDLQGSSLLQSSESLRQACRVLIGHALQENILWLEVRCSPVNYTRGGLSADDVVKIIDEEFKNSPDALNYALLFIASRHGDLNRIREHVELARRLTHGSINLQGFDLAGNEKASKAAGLREHLLPMMEHCLHLTIHAGETENVDSIWQAVYHLNAERIGHGLTLKNNPALMERFIDKNIALEMCPSSNMQIVGFKDAYFSESGPSEIYPLKDYMEKGLRVTVNTDNPGISRTNISAELHRAARMTPGGLSVWEILSLIRNGFKAAFTPKENRNRMLREAEKQIMKLIGDGLFRYL